jgi:hypothetical protein
MSAKHETGVSMTYDSKHATLEHISHVRTYLFKVLSLIQFRAAEHDNSMLQPEEKKLLDVHSPQVFKSEPGSREHQEALQKLLPALNSHFQKNTHHIEHYGNINGMDLIDLIEWLCDQQASALRTPSQDINDLLDKNFNKYKFPQEMVDIIRNTVKRHF